MRETYKQRKTYKCNDMQAHRKNDRNRHTNRYTKIETDTETQSEKQTEAKGSGFMNQAQKDSFVDNNYKFAIYSLQSYAIITTN